MAKSGLAFAAAALVFATIPCAMLTVTCSNSEAITEKLSSAEAGIDAPSSSSDDDASSDDDSGPSTEDARRDSMGQDAKSDSSSPSDCVKHPTTHEEIINACTSAERVDKQPVLPLRLPDGALPPLP